MNLIHFSKAPIGPLVPVKQTATSFGKPKGFWFSDEDDYGWKQWARDNRFAQDRFEYQTRLEIVKDKVLLLSNGGDLELFTRKYGRNSGHWADSFMIEWDRVAESWGGILITPYDWNNRLEMPWYYGWDCASGCVWDPEAVRVIECVKTPLAPIH